MKDIQKCNLIYQVFVNSDTFKPPIMVIDLDFYKLKSNSERTNLSESFINIDLDIWALAKNSSYVMMSGMDSGPEFIHNVFKHPIYRTRINTLDDDTKEFIGLFYKNMSDDMNFEELLTKCSQISDKFIVMKLQPGELSFLGVKK